MSCNNFRLIPVLYALDLTLWDFIKWYKEDREFREELHDLISIFKEILRIKALEQGLSGKTKANELITLIDLLPSPTSFAPQEQELLSILPQLLGEEGEKILQGQEVTPKQIKH